MNLENFKIISWLKKQPRKRPRNKNEKNIYGEFNL